MRAYSVKVDLDIHKKLEKFMFVFSVFAGSEFEAEKQAINKKKDYNL